MSNILNRSASFLRIRRGSILDLATSVVVLRTFCQEPPWQSRKLEPRAVPKRSPNDLYVPKQYTVEDFKDLLETKKDAKKCHLILLEIASLLEDTGKAPTEIRKRDMKDLLSSSTELRHKYYSYMIKREKARSYEIYNRALAKVEEMHSQSSSEPEASSDLFYHDGRKNQFKSSEMRRLLEAAMFGQKIFFDYGFNDCMTRRERRNLAQQIKFAYGANRAHPRPFDLNVCNIDKNSDQMELLRQHFATEDPEKLLIGTTEKSYLDLCPKKELIYLSPDSPNPLEDWDHSANFIIGGIVDRSIEKPLTLAKAKKEGIKCARLPIEERVLLRSGGHKNLALNHVLNILLTMRDTNDWGAAFEKLPRRFICELGDRIVGRDPRPTANRIRELRIS